MNTERDFDRLLDQWFADGPMEVADRVVLQVGDRIERQSQRPAWRLPGRDFQVNLKLRWTVVAAAVLVVAVFAGTRLLGPATNSGVGGALPTPIASPSPSPSSSVIHATTFGVPLTLTLSGGWTLHVIEPTNLELLWGGIDRVDLAFHPLNMVTLPGATVADPWIPVPADFVAWIRQRPEFTAFQTRPVTVGGRTGTEIDAEEVWTTGTKREFLRYTTGGWAYQQGDNGNRIRFVVVPGPSGDGFIIVMNATAADFDAAAAELDVVLATVQFHSPTSSPSS